MRAPLSLALAAALAAGCSSNKLATVKGRVTCSGKPFYPAAIMFSPMPDDPAAKESGKASWGSTDKDGYYTLSTFKLGDGALVGRHRVTINVEYPERPYPCKGYEKREIVFEVKPGSNEIDIRLDEFQK